MSKSLKTMIKVTPQMHIELQFTKYLHIYSHGPATYEWRLIELNAETGRKKA